MRKDKQQQKPEQVTTRDFTQIHKTSSHADNSVITWNFPCKRRFALKIYISYMHLFKSGEELSLNSLFIPLLPP